MKKKVFREQYNKLEELKEKVWNIKIEKDFKEAIETTKKLKKETTKKKVGK